jgi:sulfonate transport system substrate-binding protein
LFEQRGVDLVYREVPEGTAAMMDLLESGEVHMALCVTDGFIAGRAKGRPVSLAGTYVSSPLVWAVAGSPSGPASIEELMRLSVPRLGVSRLRSGSHTMAHYLAQMQGTDPASLSFVPKQTFAGLRESIADTSVQILIFMCFSSSFSFRRSMRFSGRASPQNHTLTRVLSAGWVMSRHHGQRSLLLLHLLLVSTRP